MKLSEIVKILEAEVLVKNSDRDPDIFAGGGSDLMSDVLASANANTLLLTGLTNQQSVRTAEIADIAVVCYVRGKRPPADTVELAREKNIIILTTKLKLFESCGRLYSAGLSGIKT